MLDKVNMRTFDYVNYSNNVLTVTRNPFGFINAKKRGVLKKTHKERPSKPNTTRIFLVNTSKKPSPNTGILYQIIQP